MYFDLILFKSFTFQNLLNLYIIKQLLDLLL